MTGVPEGLDETEAAFVKSWSPLKEWCGEAVGA
jgi:hypothetical protein